MELFDMFQYVNNVYDAITLATLLWLCGWLIVKLAAFLDTPNSNLVCVSLQNATLQQLHTVCRPNAHHTVKWLGA